MYYLYILKSTIIDKFYIGYTSDLDKRLHFHNSGFNKCSFTNKYKPWIIVYTEAFEDKLDAMNKEKFIKNMKSKEFILKLINNCPPGSSSGSEYSEFSS